MRKKSKYKPKRVLSNPVEWVLRGMVPVREHNFFIIDLRIKHHAAMTALTRGEATYSDLDQLINAMNMTEAFNRLGIGHEYSDEIREALDAIRELKASGEATERFTLNAKQMRSLNDALAIHDAQLDVATVQDMDKAISIVTREMSRLRNEEK